MSSCCGDLAKAAVQQHLYGLKLVGWPHLLVLPWPRAFLHRYVGHDAPGYGHQGIYKLFAAISGLKHVTG